jgi:hypothetical protein
VLGGTILLTTGVPVVGQLQAKRERRPGLQVPGEVAEDVVGELGSACVWGVVCCLLFVVLCCALCLALSPAAGEFTFFL